MGFKDFKLFKTPSVYRLNYGYEKNHWEKSYTLSELYDQSKLGDEIQSLYVKIIEQRNAFEGMKKDIIFAELRNIYVELKALDKRLELCGQESNAQREG